MPRVSAEHEQQVRERIVLAAADVFSELGYHRATIQDVVRASGLSVGAIYSYFSGKDDLFLATCDVIADRGFAQVASMLPADGTASQKLAVGVGFFIDTIDDPATAAGPSQAIYLAQAWAEAPQFPTVRRTLVRRRHNLLEMAAALVAEAVATGELPAWLDQDGVVHGYVALLDGLLLDRIEEGDGWRRENALRYAFAVLEALLASAGSAGPPALARPAPTPFGVGFRPRPGAPDMPDEPNAPDAPDAPAP